MTRRRAVTVRVAAVTVDSDSRPGAASDFPGRPSASDPAIVLMMSFAKSFVSLSGQPPPPAGGPARFKPSHDR
jgi:hypothetical protein